MDNKLNVLIPIVAAVLGATVGSLITGIFFPGISEDSIIKVWANESELITENMTLNEAKYVLLNEIQANKSTIDELTQENFQLNEKIEEIINQKDIDIYNLKEQINDSNKEYDAIKIENAKRYAEISDYEKAIKQLNEISNVNYEVDTLKNEYINNYILNCIDIVNEYINNNDYESAIKYIDKSLALIPDNNILIQLHNEIESEKPIKLSDIGIGDYKNFNSYENSYINDTTGKKHSGENVYTINAKGDSGYIRVYLGKEYSKVKGYIAVSENSPIGRDLSGSIKINLDGEEEESYDVPNRAISPINFDIPVNDVEWFEIEYIGSYFSLMHADESFEIVISDVYLYK